MDSKGAISLDQIAAYRRKYGLKQTDEVLRKLGRLQQFYNVLSLPIGQELLRVCHDEMVKLGHRVLTDKDADDTDRSMFNAYLIIAEKWSEQIARYEQTVDGVRGAE